MSAPGGALPVSPEIGYAGATEPVQSGPAQQPRPDTRWIAAPATVAPKHNPHKRTPPATVTRDGLVQPASRCALRRSRTLGVSLFFGERHTLL